MLAAALGSILLRSPLCEARLIIAAIVQTAVSVRDFRHFAFEVLNAVCAVALCRFLEVQLKGI